MQDNNANDQKVEMWTDGACKGNPGPGGWGVLMRAGVHEKTMHGGEAQTTNNRMELLAVIEGCARSSVPARSPSTPTPSTS